MRSRPIFRSLRFLHSAETKAKRHSTRTGMGRCQGGFCLSKVIETIAKENKIAIESVVKENIGSNIIVGEVKK